MYSNNFLHPTAALAIARRHNDELVAKAERSRLVAEARRGADRRPGGHPILLVALVALVLGALLAAALLPRVVDATAGHKPRPAVFRHVSPPTSPHGQPGDGVRR
jgi:hypothetical protein